MPVRRTLIALLICASAGWGAELHTLKQETISGDLVGISGKEIVIARGADKVTTPIDQALLLTFGPQTGALPNVPWVDVELTDGTQLHCAKFTVVKNDVNVTLLGGQAVMFPLSGLSQMLANAHLDKNRKDWADVLEKTSRSRDVLAKVKDGVPNAVEGVIGGASESGEAIHFTLPSGKEGDFALANIYGMVFSRKADPNAAPVEARLYDALHNVVMVSGAEMTPTGFAVTTPAGARIEYTPAQVVKMDYSHGKRDYLSDMTPTKVDERCNGAGEAIHFRRDLNLDDKPMHVSNVAYEKGLALHAHTELVYDLKGDYREFRALVGLDDDVKGVGRPVLVVVEADGQKLAEVTLQRGVKDKAGPIPLVRNVKDVKKLRIVVTHDPAEFLDLGLYVDLADAYVSK
jgi:NPCBM/NEW2 domain